ncbi:MAG: hypothetical protein ACREJ8_01410 [Candidatus Methylomirabilales bacterium]
MRRTSKIMLTVLFAGILALGAFLALAQEKPADTMQIVRDKVAADKRLFIATNMGLTESEAKAFWPVYESYQGELAQIEARAGRLLEEYARTYRAMSDQVAKKLLDEFLAIEADRLKLRQAYLPRFRKALPDTKVGRYYQLENKIHAVVSYDLAWLIPLVK